MAKSVYVKLNSAGVRELLQGSAMQGILSSAAAARASAAGEGYESSVQVGAKRAYANIYPATKEAYYDNLDHNTLEKVIR